MSRKNSKNTTKELLIKLRNKIKEAKELHEFEWNMIKVGCKHRKYDKFHKGHGCTEMNKSPLNEKKYFYYCHYSNCPFT